MDSGDPIRIDAPDLDRNGRPDIVAMDAVAVVVEAVHQLSPCPGDAVPVPARLEDRAGERESGNRWDDHVERLPDPAVGLRVRERSDDAQIFHDRHRPSVREQQRERVGCRRPNVQEMHVETVDASDELRVGVDQRLPGAPVIAVAPILDEGSHATRRDAEVGRSRDLGNKPGPIESIGQVLEIRSGDVDPERSDRRCLPFGSHARSAPGVSASSAAESRWRTSTVTSN